MKKTATIIIAGMVAAGASAAIVDNFNTVDGAPDLTWTGDTTGFSVQATFNGLNEGAGAFRKTSGATYEDNSFVTDISAELALNTAYTFSGFVSADVDRQAVNSTDLGNYAALVLLSDSSDNAAITAGTMNGYRLGVFNGDQVELQKASGAGWTTLQAGPTAGLNLNTGFNFSATIDSATGNYSWGYMIGSYTDTVLEGNIGTDAAFTPAATTYGGFTYAAKGDISYYVDAYSMAAIPEPATFGLLASASAGLLWIRRKFTI